MESPKREPRTPASEHQGSPLFKFLCSLSPIKQTKSQAYTELNYPAPPQVFSSPTEKKVPAKTESATPSPSSSPLPLPPKSDGVTTGGTPGGIGLHLNSLTSLLPRGLSLQSFGASTQEIQSDAKGNVTITSSGAATSTTTSFRPNFLLSVVEKTKTEEQEFRTDTSHNGGIVKSTTCVRSLTLGIQAVEQPEPPGVTFDVENTTPRKRLTLTQDDGEFAHTPPPKRKRRSSTDKDGCKRCHCKKSKCLKLYCECFAAGVYCLDSCACHGCFNKPEFSETVLGVRQQIETRNPLAFAPKIIQTADDGVICPETVTALARHKRGCNCKKSQCLKKYCECYQIGVGCSDGCRCNGCMNIYGAKKAEPEEMDQIGDGQCGDFVTNTTSISPVTPFQSTPSMELPVACKPFYQTGGPCGFGVEGTRLFPSPPDQPSTRWQGSLDEICSITPLAQHPLRPPTTASVVKTETGNCVTSSTPAYPSGDSPDTPVSKVSRMMDSDNLFSDAKTSAKDETPEFLRDDRRLVIQGGSPKQKRVVPPNIHGSGGILRSGRKLTLQTLPSLPPVTSFRFSQQVHFKQSS